jgi:hypothetical protein
MRQLDPSTSYQFSVRAFDSSGDELGSSNTEIRGANTVAIGAVDQAATPPPRATP